MRTDVYAVASLTYDAFGCTFRKPWFSLIDGEEQPLPNGKSQSQSALGGRSSNLFRLSRTQVPSVSVPCSPSVLPCSPCHPNPQPVPSGSSGHCSSSWCHIRHDSIQWEEGDRTSCVSLFPQKPQQTPVTSLAQTVSHARPLANR